MQFVRTWAVALCCAGAVATAWAVTSSTARVARVNAATLAGLASAPATPRDVRIHTAQLSNDTDLEWEANREPDVTGYEIVSRDTVEPYWTNAIPVGDVTSFKVVGLTKDNYLFGVRSVDRDGNRSPVGFPRPVS